MKRSVILMFLFAAAVAGCGGGSGSSTTTKEVARLTVDEVGDVYGLRSDVTAYCTAAAGLTFTDPGTAASEKAMDKVTAEYGRVLTSLDAYVAVLRRKPDVRPPAGDPLLHDTPRHDAEDLLSDELAGCVTDDDGLTADDLKKWRGRIRTVLAGLPPAVR
jgi:hypothetical protein